MSISQIIFTVSTLASPESTSAGEGCHAVSPFCSTSRKLLYGISQNRTWTPFAVCKSYADGSKIQMNFDVTSQ